MPTKSSHGGRAQKIRSERLVLHTHRMEGESDMKVSDMKVRVKFGCSDVDVAVPDGTMRLQCAQEMQTFKIGRAIKKYDSKWETACLDITTRVIFYQCKV